MIVTSFVSLPPPKTEKVFKVFVARMMFVFVMLMDCSSFINVGTSTNDNDGLFVVETQVVRHRGVVIIADRRSM